MPSNKKRIWSRACNDVSVNQQEITMYYLMNSAIMPNNGKYESVPIKQGDVRFFLKNNPFISAIGHQSTADLLSKLMDVSIPTNRITVSLKDGDIMIVFKLKTRLPEGIILNEEELAKLEYEFSYVTYIAPKVYW